jgi:intracellular sulfur oxidation DsrE/DsrF family protein
MKKYLLIESRDPFESGDVATMMQLAIGLAAEGSEVAVFLVQNGVLPARFGSKADGLAKLAASGIAVHADDFSLRERAITPESLVRGVSSAPIGLVIDRMADGWNVIWH